MSDNIIKGFHHIALKVKDFNKSAVFYEALGFKLFTEWTKDGLPVRMYDIGDGGILELFAGGGDHLSENGKWMHFAMRTDDVDKAYKTAISAGATPLTAPKTVPLDSHPVPICIRVAFVKGPDGEELEFFNPEK